jgi:hypothetical protein
LAEFYSVIWRDFVRLFGGIDKNFHIGGKLFEGSDGEILKICITLPCLMNLKSVEIRRGLKKIGPARAVIVMQRTLIDRKLKNEMLMKKIYLLMMFTLAALSFGLSACSNDDDDDIIWDFAPVDVTIYVTDANGADLIAADGSLYQSDIKMIYRGEEYDARWDFATTRYYMPYMYGLCYIPAEGEQAARLVFGELNGDLGDADLTLVMPDGTQHAIHIHRVITTSGSDCSVNQRVTLDGRELEEFKNGGTSIQFTLVYP